MHDVDALQDLLLRVVPPFAIAFGVGAATVALVWAMLPAAGLILLVALLIAATLVPWLTGRLAARGEARQAAARAELTSSVVDLIEGAPELVVNGAAQEQLRRTLAADSVLTRIAGASARTAGIGQGLTSLCSGLAMWGALLVGVAAVHAGRLNGVLLAGLALIPLVAFELVTGLPTATQTLQRVRRSAARVFEVMDTPAPVSEPAHPLALPPPPHVLRVRGLRFTYPGARRPALDGVDLDLSPGRRVAVVGPSGAGKSTLAGVLLRFLSYEGGSVTLDGVELADLDGDASRTVVGLVSQDAHVFDSTLEENLRLARREASAGRAARGPREGALARLDRAAARRAGHGGGRARRAHVRRSAPAPGGRQGAARGLPAARPGRARRASRHSDRGRDRRRPAGAHARDGRLF